MDFSTAIEIILLHEGGFSDDPNDKGGLTKFGISKQAYPDLDIPTLTIEQAKQIYYDDYWHKIRAEQLPEFARLLMLNCSVNMGPHAAIQLMQKAIGVTPDSEIGPITLRAIYKMEAHEFIVNFCAEMALRYASLSSFKHFGRGWMRRLFDVALKA